MSFYKQVLSRVREVAKGCGRGDEEVCLITVSKNHSWTEAKEAYDQGCRNFGENRVQEALPKMEEAPSNVHWHLIGTLQKNKVPKILGKFHLVHSVDTPELVEKLSASSVQAHLATSILLQVNTSGEVSKHGLSENEWNHHFHRLTKLPALNIQGLMTMAPLTEDRKVIRQTFRRLHDFKKQLESTHNFKLPFLSMGMSHDFEIAIEEGATHLRVGSSIFGN